jgi:UMF1 family MFS transporter
VSGKNNIFSATFQVLIASQLFAPISFIHLCVPACNTLIPLWGMVGFFSKSFGVRNGWEIIVVAVWYGCHLGAYQAFSRAIFATLVPRGKESGFFSAYELTNKGSSAVGPVVLSVLQQITGELR